MIVTPPLPQITGSPKFLTSTRVNDLTFYSYNEYLDDNTGMISTVPAGTYLNPIDNITDNETNITFPAGNWEGLTFAQDVETSIQYHFEIVTYPDATGNQNGVIDNGIVRLQFDRYNAANQFVETMSVYFYPIPMDNAREVKKFNVEIPRTQFKAGDYITIYLQTASGHRVIVKKGTSIKAVSPSDISTYPLIDGSIYDMSLSVPTDIKQVDFIKDFIKLFNLFVTQDANDPSLYVFTPQPNFYIKDKTKAINLSNKIDYNEEIEFTPISQLTAKEYILTWKADKDYWNEFYTARNKEIYGQVTYITDTDVLSNKETIEMLFSPAVMTRFTGSKIICPAIYKVETDNGLTKKKSDKFNSRLLIWGGLKPTGHNLNMLNSDGSLFGMFKTFTRTPDI
jgi:hypothetical protein